MSEKNYPRVMVTPKGVGRLRKGHPWVFRSDVKDASQAAMGDLVRIQDERGRPLGLALFNPHSLISLRRWSSQDVGLTRETLAARLSRAAALRRKVVCPATTAYRLVFGESDLLPGLIVDRYGDILVLQALCAAMDRALPLIVEALREIVPAQGILARHDSATRELEGLPREVRVLAGQVPQRVMVLEEGVPFGVDPYQGQKTGAFLDQRDNRTVAARLAQGRVLDLFCYEGWFAIRMAAAAQEVMAVEISPQALERARAQADAQGLANITFLQANAFDVLHSLKREGRAFDLIVLDPPAFAKSRAALSGAWRGYKEINLRALGLLSEGGVLITSSCSYHMPEEAFGQMLLEAALDAGKRVQILEKRSQGLDHPALLGFPESRYLKCLVARVTGE